MNINVRYVVLHIFHIKEKYLLTNGNIPYVHTIIKTQILL